MVISSPEMAKETKPGQFLEIRVVDDIEPLLRRPNKYDTMLMKAKENSNSYFK